MAPTGIDRIEIKVGTYRAHMDVNASMDMKRAKHVVTAWKGGLFRGATLATRDASSKRWEPISLASVLTMFDVKTSKAVASAPATESPADPIAEIADRREMEIAREVESEFRNKHAEKIRREGRFTSAMYREVRAEAARRLATEAHAATVAEAAIEAPAPAPPINVAEVCALCEKQAPEFLEITKYGVRVNVCRACYAAEPAASKVRAAAPEARPASAPPAPADRAAYEHNQAIDDAAAKPAAAPKARKAPLCAYPGARVIVNCTRVPFWTLRDGARCHGEAVQLPHGVAGEIIDGDADRPLIRATHPTKGDVFGWVLPGDFELAPAPVSAAAEAAPAPKAPRKRAAKPAAAPAPAAAPEAPASEPAPEAAPAAPASAIDPNPLSIFTVGIEELSPTRLAEIVSERAIDLIVDIRSKSKTPAFSVANMRAAWGAKYVTKAQLKGGLIAILPALKAQGSARVLFLREEEAPGDHYGTMEMGRLAMVAGLPMVHLYRNEEVTHVALQKAIDEDLATGGDHYYECEIEETPESAAASDNAKVRDRIAKLERRAADKGSSASEVETCRAEIERLKASTRKAA